MKIYLLFYTIFLIVFKAFTGITMAWITIKGCNVGDFWTGQPSSYSGVADVKREGRDSFGLLNI